MLARDAFTIAFNVFMTAVLHKTMHWTWVNYMSNVQRWPEKMVACQVWKIRSVSTDGQMSKCSYSWTSTVLIVVHCTHFSTLCLLYQLYLHGECLCKFLNIVFRLHKHLIQGRCLNITWWNSSEFEDVYIAARLNSWTWRRSHSQCKLIMLIYCPSHRWHYAPSTLTKPHTM